MQRFAAARVWILLAPFLVVLGFAAGVARGQGVRMVPGGDESQGRNRVYPPTDRTMSRGMRRAEENIAGGEFAQPLSFLDEVLGKSEDFFTETGSEGGYVGLKATARRLIRDLPPEGRRAYEMTYGPVAERMLKSALATGDAAQLQAVTQRYFYTPAGYQAAMLLATNESDAGRHLSAALLYQQLIDTPAAVRLHDPELSVRAAASWLAADDAAHAKQILEALASRGKQSIEIAGRDYSLETGADALAWLRSNVGEPMDETKTPESQWLNYRGNAARNGETSGGLPHMRVRWRAPMLQPYVKLEELFEEYNSDLVHAGQSTPVANVPLAAGDTIIVRTPVSLLAVDFRTGNRIWRSELQRDTQLEQLIKSGAGSEEDAQNAEAARVFARRIWEDYLYNVTSSDGDRVYAIRDLPMPSATDYEMSPFLSASSGQENSTPTNRLSAYDLATEGSLVWELDGAATTGELAGAFFLGAPLPVGPSLYVLVEIRDDIYLAALDRSNGAVQWRQQLANLENGVVLDLRRRLQAAMPSYDAGMLVCPTGAGVVVGVDLAKRSLAWAYRYETMPPMEGVYRGGPEEANQELANHWTDCAATIADGRILLTPPESTDLHCLDLRTGKLLWKQPRGEMQRLAHVADGRALLVGPRKVTSLRLADGKPAWDGPETSLPRGAAPAGNGFVSDGKYFFPLTTAEVVSIDLASGAITSRVRSHDGSTLGNLICHRGTVISQNGRFLDCFDQIDVLRSRSETQLAKDQNNVDALRALGEIAYNEGRVSEAISLGERAYRAAPKELETREMLAECLADALDTDFASYRSHLPLLKELEGVGSVSALQVLRIEAQGLLESGDRLASAAACLELYRGAAAAFEPLKIRRDHETLVSRWVAAQLATIWDAASEGEQKNIADQVRKLAPRDGADGDEMERYIAFFGALPEIDQFKLANARRLTGERRDLEAQQTLLDLTSSRNMAVRREAVARIASHLHSVGMHRAASEFDAQLAREFANDPCLDGVTGKELVAKWAEAIAAATVKWAAGKVEIRTVAASGGGATAPRARAPVWGVRLEHSDSILASGCGFLANRGSNLTWQDGYGRDIFTLPLEPETQAIFRQSGSVYGALRGNLLIISLGRELAAFNTLAKPDGQGQPLMWRASLGSNFEYQEQAWMEVGRTADRRPGSHRAPRMTLDNKWVGVIGPIGSRGVIFQDQRRLMCVDPETGEVLWSRRDAPVGCDLFGDDRFVFATPTGTDTALVYSAIDGRSLGEARLPAWEEQLGTRGRLVIRWRRLEDGRCELAAVDPLAKEPVWRKAFDAEAQVDIDGDRYVAVVEPQGRATIIDASTGDAILEQMLPREPRMAAVHLTTSAESFTLIVEHSQSHNTDRDVRPFNGGDAPVIDGDVVVLDRATGRMNWPRPATVLRQALLLDQPPDLPFIAFSGTLVSSRSGESREMTTLLLIDKATGRTLVSADDIPQSGAGYCLPRLTEASRGEVTVELPGRAVVLQYTDGRRPPDPPAMADVESAAGKVSRGIMGILFGSGD